MTLAMPMPSRSPRIRRHSSPAASPCRAASHGPRAVHEAAGGGEAVQRPPGGEPLERAGLGEALGRRRAVLEVGADDDVPELGGRSGRPAVDPSVDHYPAAYPGADREHHEMSDVDLRVGPVGLGDRRDGGVVVDVDRQAEALAQDLAQRDLLQRDVDRGAGHPPGEVHDARDADADRVGGQLLLDRLDELLDERVGRRRLGGADAGLAEAAVLEDGRRDLRAADVEAHQPAHVPQPLTRRVPGVPGARRPAVRVRCVDEADLLERLRARDERAFADVVRAWSPAMLRLARMHVADRAAAEEVVQEAWLGVLQGIDRFEGRSSLKTWVFRILANRAMTKGAREARSLPFAVLAADEAAADEPAVDPSRFARDGGWSSPPKQWDESPELALRSEETLRVARAAIAGLPPMQRLVILMRDLEGFGAEETCNALEISETNQRVLLHRARARVRTALEAHYGEADEAVHA